MKNSSLPRISMLVAASILAFGAGAAHARVYRAANVHVDSYPTVQTLKYMGDEINKATGGQDSLKVFSNSALGSSGFEPAAERRSTPRANSALRKMRPNWPAAPLKATLVTLKNLLIKRKCVL